MGDLADDDVMGWEQRLRAAEAIDSPESRAQTPYLTWRVGFAQRRKGQVEAALRRYARAVGLLEQLPRGAHFAEDLAFLTFETGMLATELGTEEASTWLHRSVQAHQALPQTPAVLTMLVRLEGTLGDWNARQGDVAWAIEHLGRAIALGETLCATEPSPSAHRDLAVSYSKLASVQGAAGRLDEAITAHLRALELRRSLASAAPGNEVARAAVLISLEELEDLCTRAGRADAQSWAVQVEQERVAYARDFPR